MKIIHRVSVNPDDKKKRQLADLGVASDDAGVGVLVFSIEESDPKWDRVSLLLSSWRSTQIPVVDLITTTFSKTELKRAALLLMRAAWHVGYPQPEEAFGYRGTTYDDSDFCPHCGTGLIQRAPFSMLGEPKWGTRQILQLNWVFDEFFVTPEVWERVFKPFGISTLPVKDHSNGRALASVVQLKVTDSANLLTTDGLVPQHCGLCHHIRFPVHIRGAFPVVELPKSVHIAKTREYFGSGVAAWHETIVSEDLYRAIDASRLKGADFGVVRSAR